jgi:hypothetical protein
MEASAKRALSIVDMEYMDANISTIKGVSTKMNNNNNYQRVFFQAESVRRDLTRRRLTYPSLIHESRPAGFSFCFDNVQFAAHARVNKADQSAQFHMMTLSLAVRHRVLSDSSNRNVAVGLSAATLDPYTFLPNPSSFRDFEEYMVVYVQRIVADVLPALNHLLTHELKHVKHEHTEEMTCQSEIVSLGVTEGNPSLVPDTIDILDQLMGYVPTTSAGSMYVPVYGDAATIDTITKAKKSRALSSQEGRNFRCMTEVGQEFHKEGLLLGVNIKHI